MTQSHDTVILLQTHGGNDGEEKIEEKKINIQEYTAIFVGDRRRLIDCIRLYTIIASVAN